MKRYLITSSPDVGEALTTDDPKEAYELAAEMMEEYDVDKVYIYQLRDVGVRHGIRWASQQTEQVQKPKKIRTKKAVRQMHRTPWTDSEQLLLQQLFKENRSIQEIAAILGRTDKAISNRLYRKGIR